MNEFLTELRSRKVYRTAAGYAVVAWLLIQICATVFPAWDLPRWALRLVIILVLAGFPIALVLAWAFDIKAAPSPRPENKPDEFGLRPFFTVRKKNLVLLLLVGLALSAITGFLVLPRAGAHKREKSIAVLPFDNFSDDKENEHFANGVQDDLLTSLAKIGDLKVISRTSVMPYRGKPHNIREIGQELGVSSIVEGSIRRSGNQIRLVVQLIDTANDHHLWAQDYDREVLTDVFAVQSALAHEIATQLRANLSPVETARMQERPTINPKAYRIYLEAHDITTQTDRSLDVLKRAEQLYQEVTELDPAFALAFAQLSQLESWIYYSFDPTPARSVKARTAAEAAIRLQPNLPESHLALGYTYYYVDLDYDRAMAQFEIARQGLPNDAGIFRAISAIERRQGKWKQSIQHREKAASLSPTDSTIFENLGTTHAALRDFPAAAKAFDRAASLVPGSLQTKVLRAQLEIDLKGDLGPMKKLLSNLPEDSPDANGMLTLARFNLHFLERNYDEALAVLWRNPLENLHGETSTPLPKSFLAGQIYRLVPDKVKARDSYEHALGIAERAVAESPQEASRHALLGLIYAGLDRKEEAVSEGNRAVELLPESKDAFDGPIFVVSLARIHAIIGQREKAIDLLKHSLEMPAGTTVSELRLDPTWDSLRDHPRFRALIK